MLLKFILIFSLSIFSSFINSNSLIIYDQSQEISAARCYSKCLQIFIRFKTIFDKKIIRNVSDEAIRSPVQRQATPQLAYIDELAQNLMISSFSLKLCFQDDNNQCSRQCFKCCSIMPECVCQQNDIGCLLACNFRKEMSKEINYEDCPSIYSVEESSPKMPKSRCPKTCKTKADCIENQQCCNTETCGPICLQVEGLIPNLPKYTPIPTQSSTQSNIEFDWSQTFSKHLKDELPLVFILQTRTCLCYKIVEKLLTPWQTLIMTHRLGAKLNALDNGTIYQFRLSAVSPYGTNGFGSISQNLPTLISKPAPPFPPENLLEYKWKVTDTNMFNVEIKWDEPKVSSWRTFEYFLSWMVDHGIVQSEGEPMSSFTQYTKVLPVSLHQTVIEDLQPSTTYKIQIVTKTEWPGYGDILSNPTTMYVTTPAIIFPEQSPENFNKNIGKDSCSCPEHKINEIEVRIRQPIFVNKNLQITVDMNKYSDYVINVYPEICIDNVNGNNMKSQNKDVRIYEQTSEIILSNLQFNCRYSLEIVSVLKSSQNLTYQLCFCTPPCYKTYQGKVCPDDDISELPAPKNVKFSLFNYNTMTYKVSWEPINNIQEKKALSITKYRIGWAPRKFEPVPLEHYNDIIGIEPIFDEDRSDVRIVQSNITGLLLHNLTKYELYIVRIQSLTIFDNGQFLESRPITILMPTHGYSELYFYNSQRKFAVNLSLLLIIFNCFYSMVHLYF